MYLVYFLSELSGRSFQDFQSTRHKNIKFTVILSTHSAFANNLINSQSQKLNYFLDSLTF